MVMREQNNFNLLTEWVESHHESEIKSQGALINTGFILLVAIPKLLHRQKIVRIPV